MSSQFSYVVPNRFAVIVDLRSPRCRPAKTFVQPLSASVRLVSPQLSVSKPTVASIVLGYIQDKGCKTLPPAVGMYGDHRDVGKPRQRIRAGAVLIETLQDEHHRNQF